MKRDLRKAEEEEQWREKANNRDKWKQITKVAVLRSDQPHPYTREPEEEQHITHRSGSSRRPGWPQNGDKNDLRWMIYGHGRVESESNVERPG